MKTQLVAKSRGILLGGPPYALKCTTRVVLIVIALDEFSPMFTELRFHLPSGAYFPRDVCVPNGTRRPTHHVNVDSYGTAW